MKKLLFLSVAFTVFYVMQTPLAEGQILYNYALGGDSFSPSNSVVRTVSDQKVIASYWDGTNYRLARVGLIDIISAKLDDHHQIADIRIVDNDIFFCGMDRSNYEAFLGHATISGIESQTPHIQLLNLKVEYSTNTRLWRLAAYLDLAGVTHLVAVGDFWYTYDGVSSFPFGVPSCSLFGNCQSTFAVEYECNSGTFVHIDTKVFHDIYYNYEYACDVVETDNYVAIVTFPAADELIIHRCNKTNVLASLSNPNTYYYYNVPPVKVDFHGCKMKGDTIAVASVFNDGPGTDNMQVRVVDLASMNMPYAQTFDLLDKDDIYEMTYLPDIQKLVLLTDHTYTPLTSLIHTFCFLKPYETVFPYNMEKIYESSGRSFTSLDRLFPKYIVAAGGDYWILKDVTYNNPASGCYDTRTHQVRNLTTSNPGLRFHIFLPTNTNDVLKPCYEEYEQTGLFARCITY